MSSEVYGQDIYSPENAWKTILCYVSPSLTILICMGIANLYPGASKRKQQQLMERLVQRHGLEYYSSGCNYFPLEKAAEKLWCAKTGFKISDWERHKKAMKDQYGDSLIYTWSPFNESEAYYIYEDKTGRPFPYPEPGHYVVPYNKVLEFGADLADASIEKEWRKCWNNELAWREERVDGHFVKIKPQYPSDLRFYEDTMRKFPCERDKLKSFFDWMNEEQQFIKEEKATVDHDQMRLLRRKHWAVRCNWYGNALGVIARDGFLDDMLFVNNLEEAEVPTIQEAKLTPGRLLVDKYAKVFYHTNHDFADFCMKCLERHMKGDWGDVTDEEKAWNDQYAENGENRVWSSYNVPPELSETCGPKLEIITEYDGLMTLFSSPLFQSEIDVIFR